MSAANEYLKALNGLAGTLLDAENELADIRSAEAQEFRRVLVGLLAKVEHEIATAESVRAVVQAAIDSQGGEQ